MQVIMRWDMSAINRVIASLGRAARKTDEDLAAGLRVAAGVAEATAAANALSRLPRRGGLARDVAGSRFAIKSQRGSDSVSVSLVVTSDDRYDLERLDQGVVKHPVYGDPPWVRQTVPAGWFSSVEPVAESAAEKAVLSLLLQTASMIR